MMRVKKGFSIGIFHDFANYKIRVKRTLHKIMVFTHRSHLNKGCDTSIEDKQGRSALDYAKAKKLRSIVSLIQEKQ